MNGQHRKTFRCSAAILLLTFLSAESTASTTDQLIEAECRLGIDVAMFIDDTSNRDRAGAVRSSLDAITTLLHNSAPDSLPADARGAWESEKNDIASLLSSGYEAPTHMNFMMNQRSFHEALLAANSRKGAADDTELKLSVCDVIKNYLLITTSPMGTYNSSYNDNSETDFQKGVSTIDDAFSRKISTATGSDLARLKSAQTHWNFIRGAILDIGKRSLPTIVHRNGIFIIDTLSTGKQP